MARYIDVEPLEDKLKEHIKKTESELMLGALSTFLRVLDITPTADVAPIKHGRWKEQKITFNKWGGDVVTEKTLWRCSVCGHEDSILTNYCSNCGARMDGGNDEID